MADRILFRMIPDNRELGGLAKDVAQDATQQTLFSRYPDFYALYEGFFENPKDDATLLVLRDYVEEKQIHPEWKKLCRGINALLQLPKLAEKDIHNWYLHIPDELVESVVHDAMVRLEINYNLYNNYQSNYSEIRHIDQKYSDQFDKDYYFTYRVRKYYREECPQLKYLWNPAPLCVGIVIADAFEYIHNFLDR